MVHGWIVFGISRVGLDWIEFLVYCLGLLRFMSNVCYVYAWCMFGVGLVYVGLSLVYDCVNGGSCLVYVWIMVGVCLA